MQRAHLHAAAKMACPSRMRSVKRQSDLATPHRSTIMPPTSGSTMLGNEYTEYRPSKSDSGARGRRGISRGGAERSTQHAVCPVRRQSVTEVEVLGGAELGRQQAVQRGGVVVAVVVAYHQQREQHEHEPSSGQLRLLDGLRRVDGATGRQEWLAEAVLVESLLARAEQAERVPRFLRHPDGCLSPTIVARSVPQVIRLSRQCSLERVRASLPCLPYQDNAKSIF